MEERNQLQRITQHLQKADVQQRIMQDMQRAREEATVTISNAANLFSFTENQLRDWEKNGLLRPQRGTQDSDQDGKGPRRRQYTTAELDKLAIIRELLNASFSPGFIPTYVDEIWAKVAAGNGSLERTVERSGKDTDSRPIDQRVEQIEKAAFWRYFVSQSLRLSLMLICESVPETVAGIILPLGKTGVATIVRQSTDMPHAGYSLVGWLNQNRSFYTFLEEEPSFEHPSDFRVEPLVNLAKNVFASSDTPREQLPQDNVLIIVQRKTKPLLVRREAVKAVQRILGLLYSTTNQWQPGFENGIRHWMYQVTDFASSSETSDEVLNGLATMIVQMGGKSKTEDGQNKWQFCSILTPQDISLPLQQRTLLMRAQSEQAPYNFPAISATMPGLSFRAFLSGQIIYRSDVSSHDFMVARPEIEETTRSAIAIPLGSDEGLAIGVMYIAANEPNAFSEDDWRALRIIGRMVEELLLTYNARLLPPGKLTAMITTPKIVDSSFKAFLSEGDFVNDVEALLKEIFARNEDEKSLEEDVSFIAVDIDNQSNLAFKYGDRVAKILSRAVGLRVQGQMRLFSNFEHHRVYHVSADRYYLILKGMPLQEARNKAAQFKDALEGEYLLDARRVTTGRPPIPESMLRLPDVTVRLGIISYKTTKLKELLGRYEPGFAVAQVAGLISQSIDQVLVLGLQEGGSCFISWDPEIWGYKRWTPS